MNVPATITRHDLLAWASFYIVLLGATATITLYIAHISTVQDAHIAADAVRDDQTRQAFAEIKERINKQDGVIAGLDVAGSRQLPAIMARQDIMVRQIEDLTRKINGVAAALQARNAEGRK